MGKIVLCGLRHALWPAAIDSASPTKERLAHLAFLGGLLASLALVLIHAAFYSHLLDDAFISFRYARNFAEGHGLVFNPGHEAVEGYTNFLWVMILAGGHALGILPETTAIGLSYLSTIVLFGLVSLYPLRFAPVRGSRYLLLLPPFFLALTRSIAIWSTSGLETRFFEVLILAGMLRLIREIRSIFQAQSNRLWPISAIFLAMATLTRPDGLLISSAVFLALLLTFAWRRQWSWKFLARFSFFYLCPVLAHFIFRWFYYRALLPNTYYAKVYQSGWLEMGTTFLAAFSLEYAAFLWIPLIVLATLHHFSHKSGYIILLIAAVILPHALYLAYIGGDHFEYRPLDLYFPLIFFLLYDGAVFLAKRPLRATIAGLLLLLTLGGLIFLPWLSHKHFPKLPFTASADPSCSNWGCPR